MKKTASVFKGVHVSDFFQLVLHNKGSYLSETLVDALSGEGSFTDVEQEVKRLLEEKKYKGRDAKTLRSVLSWPVTFCKALTEAYEHCPTLENLQGPEAGPAVGQEVGLDEDIIHDLVLLHRLDKSRFRGEKPTFDHAIDVVAKSIRLVLSKLPEVHRYRAESLRFLTTMSMLRGFLPGNVPMSRSKDPDLTWEESIDAYIRDYASERYDLNMGLVELHKGLDPNVKALGSYISAHHTVVIYKLSLPTIAHEIGHAIWDYSYSAKTLTNFLAWTSLKAGTHARTAREFVDRLAVALDGLELRETDRTSMVTKLEDTWGASYASKFKKERDIKHMHRLLMSKTTQEIVQRYAKKADRKNFLVAWNEAWAEGFAEILLPEYKSKTMHVPGVIHSIINELLRLGTSQ